MTDFDLDEDCEPNSTGLRADRRRRADGRRARSASSLGFEEIQRFVEKHGYAPHHGEDRDIFERLYAVRLDRLRAPGRLPHACPCTSRPSGALLTGAEAVRRCGRSEEIRRRRAAGRTRDGRGTGRPASPNSTCALELPTSARRRKSPIATKCEDFDKLQTPIHSRSRRELENWTPANASVSSSKAEITPGSWFIVGGQKAYVAEMGRDVFNAARPHGCAPARNLSTTAPKATCSCGFPRSARCTKTTQADGSLIPLRGRCSLGQAA